MRPDFKRKEGGLTQSRRDAADGLDVFRRKLVGSVTASLFGAMAYTPELEAGEELAHQTELCCPAKAEPFCFAVSNRALYIPRKKLVALKDPYYFERVPHSGVREVSIERLRPYGWWVLAILMTAAGLVSTILMMWPFFHGHQRYFYSLW